MLEAGIGVQPFVEQEEAGSLIAGAVNSLKDAWARFNQPETYQKTLTVLATAHFASLLMRFGAMLAGEYAHTHPEELQMAKGFLADLFADHGPVNWHFGGGDADQGIALLQATPEPTPNEIYPGSCSLTEGVLYQQLAPEGNSLLGIAEYYNVDVADLLAANPGIQTDADLIGCSCLQIPVENPQTWIENAPIFTDKYCPDVTPEPQFEATVVTTTETSLGTATPEEMATSVFTNFSTPEATPLVNIPQATDADNYWGESSIELISAGLVTILSAPAVVSAGTGILNMLSGILIGRKNEILTKLSDFRVTYGFYGKIFSNLNLLYRTFFDPNDPNGNDQGN